MPEGHQAFLSVYLCHRDQMIGTARLLAPSLRTRTRSRARGGGDVATGDDREELVDLLRDEAFR